MRAARHAYYEVMWQARGAHLSAHGPAGECIVLGRKWPRAQFQQVPSR